MVNDLAGRRILITGADGFIGSHLTERMVRDGAEVTAFALYTSTGSAGWLDEVPDDVRGQFRIVLGDIRDPELVRSATRGVEVAFHLAALIAIPYSYQAPRSFVDTNVSGTLNVLEAARSNGFRLVSTSTSEVYGTPKTLPITEDHPLQGQSPYSATKIASDKLCEAYASSFDLPVTILRPFNTFGPRQSMRAVIPVILGQLLSGVEELQLGVLSPRRDFTFVTDTVDGLVRAGRTELPPGTVVQLGTGRAVSIGELVDLAAELLGVACSVRTDDDRLRPSGSEVEVLVSDPSRAVQLLDWSPTVGLEDGLRATAEWLRPRISRESALRYQR
ncbi:NAD-dependent 4,6-dehydratase LegB [soil metagenome]